MKIRAIAATAAMALVCWTALIPGARAQEVLDAWVEFLWKDYTQAACLDRAAVAIDEAALEFGLDVTTRTAEWNVLGINDDINFWVFCVADGDGLLDPEAERILVLTSVNTAVTGIGEELRDFLTDCMDNACPQSSAGARISWSNDAVDRRGEDGALIDYLCPPLGEEFMGMIWGTEIYTDDSSICAAGVHTGVIGEDGGTVTIEILNSRKTYLGSERNGVNSFDSGSYDGSFRVVIPVG